jgi:hypothetical protein
MPLSPQGVTILDRAGELSPGSPLPAEWRLGDNAIGALTFIDEYGATNEASYSR